MPSSTTPRLTTSTNCTYSPTLLIVILGIFKFFNSLMVCDYPKTIALIFIALRVKEFRSVQVAAIRDMNHDYATLEKPNLISFMRNRDDDIVAKALLK